MLDPSELPQAQPYDEHNQRLIDNVHPADWVNPEPDGRYNMVVIGAGECEDYFDSRGFGTNAAVTDNSDVHAATCSNGQIDFRSA